MGKCFEVWNLFCVQVTLLYNDTQVLPPVTLSSFVQSHHLTSLTPGRLYKIVVSTFSGPYQRAKFVEGRTGKTTKAVSQWHLPKHLTQCLLLSSVPGAVRKLHLMPTPWETSGGLIASWTPAPGDLDMYIISLSTEVLQVQLVRWVFYGFYPHNCYMIPLFVRL